MLSSEERTRANTTGAENLGEVNHDNVVGVEGEVRVVEDVSEIHRDKIDVQLIA